MTSNTIQATRLEVGKVYRAFVAYAESQNKFWVQLESGIERLEQLHEDVVQLYANPVSRTVPLQPGTVCLATYAEPGAEDTFYRAVIQSLEVGGCRVQFVDYGNSQVCAITDLKYLPGKFCSFPAQAVECCLPDTQGNLDMGTFLNSDDPVYIRVMDYDHHTNRYTVNIALNEEQLQGQTMQQSSVPRVTHTPKYTSVKFDLGKFNDTCISHVERDGLFFLQLIDNAWKLDSLMCELTKSYNACSPCVTSAYEGLPCVFFDPEDKVLYRAEVVSVADPQCVVKCVDFGMLRTVPVSSLLSIRDEHAELPTQAIKCSLSDSENCDKSILLNLLNEVSRVGLAAKVVLRTGAIFEMELFCTSGEEDLNVSEILKQRSRSVTTPSQNVHRVRLEEPKPAAVSPINLPGLNSPEVHTGSSEELYISAVLDKNLFFGQLLRFVELEDMQAALGSYYQQAPSLLRQPRVGQDCCAAFSEDQQFYRARIEALQLPNAFVRFVDYGNGETKPTSSLFELAPEFRKLPIQGIKCQLNPRFALPTLSDFEAAILDKEITVVIESVASDCCVVDIRDCPANSCIQDLQKYVRTPAQVTAAPELPVMSVSQRVARNEEVDHRIEPLVATESSQRAAMENGYVHPVLPAGAWEEVQVTHIDDPEHFYAQLIGSGAQLDSLMEQLEAFCAALGSGGQVERAQLGMPCIARYSEDGVWYRATVTGVRRSGEVEVQFVDYGNRESMRSTDLKTIPPAYMRLPVQTIQCGLLGLVSQDGLWSAGDVDSFFNMSSESSTSPVVVCVDSHVEDRYVVHMFVGGSCINQQFGQQTGKLERSYHPPPGPPRHVGTLPSPASLEAAAARTPQSTPTRPAAAHPPPPATHPAKSPPRETTHPAAMNQPRAANSHRPAAPSASVALKPLELEINEYYDVYVAFVTSPGKFYIQLVKYENDLIKMMDMINIDYDSCSPNVSSVSAGQVLCAKYSQDERWYRAKVIGMQGGAIQVHFVDYGDEETVALSNVRRLTAEYTKLPIQSVMCELSGIKPAQGQWSEQANIKFEELTLDKPLVACMVEKRPNGSYMVELVDTAQHGQPAINEQLVRGRFAMGADPEPTLNSRRSSTSSTSSQRGDATYKRLHLPAGKSVEVAMAHVNSPQLFFCHLVESVEQLEVMMTQLDQQYTALKESDLQLLHARVGTICAAQYSEDNSWYRAEVTAAEKGKYKVKFVDYGNGEWLTANKLKILSRDYLELPAQAVECSLSGVTARNGDWTEKAISEFEDTTFNKTLMAQVMSVTGLLHTIKLTDVDCGSVDVAQLLVKTGQAVAENGMAPSAGRPTPGKLPSWGSMVEQEHKTQLRPADVTSGQRLKGFVAWMESPLDFHFHQESVLGTLETLQQQLNGAYNKLRPDEDSLPGPSVGAFCAALFTDDGSWYRAAIKAIKGERAMVMFVDYGNKQVTPLAKLKMLKADFARDAIHAIHCSMAGVTEPPNGSWSPQVVNYFKRIISQPLEIEVVSSTDGKVLVKIQDSRGNDVAQEMLNLRSGGQQRSGSFGDRDSNRGGQRSFGGRDDAPRNRREESGGFGAPRGGADSGGFGGRRDNDRSGGGFSGRSASGGGFGAPPAAAAAAASSEDWDNGGAAAAPAPKATSFGGSASSGAAAGAKVDVQHAEATKCGETLQAVVTFTDSVHSFWCQRKATMTQLDVLMEKIEAASASAKPLANPRSGNCCIAKYTADEGWYRARIMKASGGKATVHFIDYGNTEECDGSSLKELSAEHASLPAQAVRCSLEGLAAVSDRKAVERFEELTMDQDCELKVISNTGDVAVVQATVAGQNVNSMLKQEFSGGKTSTATTTPQLAAVVIPQQPTRGFVCHVESPDQFYIQLASVEEELVEFSTKVNEYYLSLGAGELALGSAVVGQPCCCLFEEDEAWYRGRLEEVSGNDTKVRFLDYGNSQVTEVTALRQLTAEFMKVPPYALECRLSGVKAKLEGWSDDAMDAFNGLVMDKVLDMKFDGDLEPVTVDLKEEGKPINSQMLLYGDPASRQATPPRPQVQEASPPRPQVQQTVPPQTQAKTEGAEQYATQSIIPGKQAAFISHLDSPTEFYIQLPSQTEELTAYMDALYYEYAEFGAQDKVISSASVGQPCCAKYSVDQSWYRAVVEDTDGSQITVRFVDYGNPETVPLKEMKLLVAPHPDKPPYAYECTLPPDLAKVPADKFSQAVQDKDLEVEFTSKSEPYVLQISVGGKTLYELLGVGEQQSVSSSSQESVSLPAVNVPSGKHAGFISHAESASDFYVQLASQTEELAAYMDSLFEEYAALDSSHKLQSGDLVNQPCVAKYSEDGSWYRAVIESMKDPATAVVRFVDYGNSDIVPLAKVMQLIAKHSEKPPYAIHCTLGAHLSDVDIDTFSTALVDKDLEVEFEGRSQPCSVLITLEGKPAWELLGHSEPPPSTATATPAGQEPHIFTTPNLTQGAESAYLSHADTPGQFFVQLAKDATDLEEFAEQLNIKYAELAEGELQVESLVKDQACCTLFSEDGLWYRATVTDVNQDQISVRFVDYGNSETTDKSKIRQITEEFASKPPFGIHCKLHGCQREWSAEDTEVFTSSIGEEEIQVTFHTTGQPAEVTVSVAGENINDKFPSDDVSGVAESSPEPAAESQTTDTPEESQTTDTPEESQTTDTPEESQTTDTPEESHTTDMQEESQTTDTQQEIQTRDSSVSPEATEESTAEIQLMFPTKTRPVSAQNIQVCHVESPSSFYVQLVGELDELEGFADQLNHTYTEGEGRELSSVEIGQTCCALYSEDELWYRALVETIDGDSITVRFVDYGNTETTTLANIRSLDVEFLSVAPYAIHCQLKGAGSSTNWSPEDVAKFESLVLDKDLEASFNSEGSICSLLAEDEDLCTAFQPAASQPSDVEEVTARMSAVEEEAPITTLPPVAAPSGTLDAYVSALSSATELYLHANKDDEAREALTKNIDESYTAGARKLQSCSVDQICCCVYAEDGQWYRARITDIKSEVATVLFVDFGNYDEVSIHEVYRLKPEFSQQPPLALPCQLAQVDPSWTDKDLDMLSDALLGKQLQATFLSTEQPYKVQFTDESGQAVPAVTLTSATSEEQSTTAASPILRPAAVPSEPCKVCVAHTESLQEIYLHPDMATLDDLMARLAEAYEGQNQSALTEPKPNSLAAVKYVEDEAWYRVQILECEGDTATVVFVDYGNQDSCPVESLRELLPEFLDKPILALECSLQGAKDLQNEEIVDRFVELTTEKSLQATFTKNTKGCEVELEDEGSDIVQMLQGLRPEKQLDGAADDSITESPQAQPSAVEEVNTNNNSGSSSPVKLEEEDEVQLEETAVVESAPTEVVDAQPEETEVPTPEVKSEDREEESATCLESAKLSWPELTCGQSLRVYVPHSSSPHAFHCQLADSSQEALPLLQDQIQALYSTGGQPLDTPAPGQHCVAQYEADNIWYRAEVSGISDGGIEVLFVDYGNTEVVQSVKVLQTEVAQLPRQAFPCSLVGILPLNEVWDEASCARFEEIVLDKALTCSVLQIHRESETVVMVDVELSDDNVAISQVLIDAGYAEKVEPITGGNTSRFIKESTMTSMLVDTSRAEVSQMESTTTEAGADTEETQPLLTVKYQAGGDPDNFQCLVVKEEQEEEEKEILHCRLTGIETDSWTDEACKLFEERCTSELQARMASKVTEGDKTIHLVYLYNPAAEHPTRSINAALVSQGHAWLSPTSELDLTTEDYDGLAEQQEKLESTFLEVSAIRSNSLGSLNGDSPGEEGEGESSSHDEEEPAEGPVEYNIKPDQTQGSHENETQGSDDENSDVDDSEPVIIEGETSSREEKEKLTEKPVENNIQSDHENETKGSDDEDSDVDDSEPVIIAVKGGSPAGGDTSTTESSESAEKTDLSAGGDA